MGALVDIAVRPVADQHPDDMAPPLAIARRVRIAIFVGELVMDSVSCNPKHRPAFERQRPADRQEILDPLRRLVGTMGQQTVIPHSDSQAQRNPVKRQCGKESRPAEEEKSGDRPSVKKREGRHRYPVDSVSSDEWPGFSFHELLTLLDGRECVPARQVTFFDTVLTTIRLL